MKHYQQSKGATRCLPRAHAHGVVVSSLLPRAHAQGVKQSVLSVCLSVCLSVYQHNNRQIWRSRAPQIFHPINISKSAGKEKTQGLLLLIAAGALI